ncbi:MAG TPA: hypothetical protein VGL77_15550 [Armatimonadota bacterium]
MPDPRDAQIRHLLDQARTSQQNGDLTTALRAAREALTLRTDCSTIHALLGHIYEQQGNLSAAHYHFQSALQVTVPAETDLISMPSAMSVIPAKQPQAGVMVLVLISCILFSGLAALFTFHSGRRQVEQSNVFQIPIARPPLATNPHWTWKTLPVPVAVSPTIAKTPAPATPPAPATGAIAVSNPLPSSSVATPPPPPEPTPPAVLGPSAHSGVPAEPAEPKLETADQAYFRGEYARAITAYEALIAQESKPNPRLFQDLAWCYQQLGNSQKASDYLGKAIQGYKALLDTDSTNAAAQQGRASCEAALRALLTTRTRETTP